MPKEI